jgi:hypothetical protein
VHEELHKRIKRLAQTGTLVCLCSRNQPALVHEAFQELEPRGLQLKLGQDILRTMVGVSAGGSKADSLRRLAQELNLSLSAFAVSLCLLVVETVQASVMVPANLLAAHISWSEACSVQLDAPGMLACMLSRVHWHASSHGVHYALWQLVDDNPAECVHVHSEVREQRGAHETSSGLELALFCA